MANGKQNSNFQTAFFIAGMCHTPDGAYSKLCDQREGRQRALANAQATLMRQQAKFNLAKSFGDDDSAAALEARADVLEIEMLKPLDEPVLEAAKEELAFIESCIEKLQPYRKYKHLPDPEAHEMAQRDEWCLEFIHRAENYMLTGHPIPPDQFSAMRAHPDFAATIFPAIQETQQWMQSLPSIVHVLEKIEERRPKLPAMIELAPPQSTEKIEGPKP